MFTMTETARNKFKEISEAENREGHGLRISVNNGGTFQPEFALSFVAPDESREGDVVSEADGVKLITDAESAKFLEDASVDFVEEDGHAGFKIDAPKAGLPKPAGSVAEKIDKILAEQINPGVSGHGGHVVLVALEDDTAYLRFGGGCQGCGGIQTTLKDGVEKVLLKEIPELKRVADITDHAAGANPYYK
jgi:Fe/S biogenesis protein NfuA